MEFLSLQQCVRQISKVFSSADKIVSVRGIEASPHPELWLLYKGRVVKAAIRKSGPRCSRRVQCKCILHNANIPVCFCTWIGEVKVVIPVSVALDNWPQYCKYYRTATVWYRCDQLLFRFVVCSAQLTRLTALNDGRRPSYVLSLVPPTLLYARGISHVS